MKESENRNNTQARLIVSIIAISVCVSLVTSSIVVKILVPTKSASISMPTTSPTIQPSSTLYVLPSVTPSTPNATPFPLQKVESNLLQNNEFENGLTGWTYTDNPEGTLHTGITVFETTGVNGKAYCSRRFFYGTQTELLNKEWIGIAQDVSVDPTEPYFFSAWVKLNQAAGVIAYAKFYYESEERYMTFLNSTVAENNGTTNGWFLIQKYIDRGVPSLPTVNHVVIGFWHAPLDSSVAAESTIDSTFCVDDVIFGKIVK